MKFLLTSAGIQNKSIAKAILDLSGLEAKDIRLVFVPTAANVEPADKGWLIRNLNAFLEQGYESIDIVDITALPKEVWKLRIEAGNVVCFSGGQESYLARCMREVGFDTEISRLFETRLYVGISAGSMVVGKISKQQLETVYPGDAQAQVYSPGLELVNLYFLPHLNSEFFPLVTEETVRNMKEEVSAPRYLVDDQSAIAIENGKISLVGEGKIVVL